MRIIEQDRSIIPACDVDTIEKLSHIVQETCDNEKVGGYKIGVSLLDEGIQTMVSTIRSFSTKPIIYDHQKAGTDIPAMGKPFMDMLKRAGVDAIILFPMAGPVTEYEWIKAAQDAGIDPIVGGEMTHPKFLDGNWTYIDPRDTDMSQKLGCCSGFISPQAPDEIYKIAAQMGVTNFVVPGNKPERIQRYRNLIEAHIGSATFFAPGFVAQGGVISESAQAAGDNFHAIVGRGIYNADDMSQAALDLTQNL